MATPATTAFLDQLTLINISKASIIVIIGIFVAKVMTIIMNRFGPKRTNPQHLLLLRRLSFYIITTVFVLSALEQLGFRISVLLGAAGIFTVALGFASQTSASNFISGLFLIFEKPFAIGDILTVDGVTGTVISIDTLSVKLRTPDNLFVRIPNENIIKTNIINISKYSTRRFDLALGVSYKENINNIRILLLEVADKNDFCLKEPEPQLQFISFGESAINLQFSVWSTQETFALLKMSLAQEIKECFDKNNVEMPYPSHTIMVHQPLPVKIERK